jgi:hypothetical protein
MCDDEHIQVLTQFSSDNQTKRKGLSLTPPFPNIRQRTQVPPAQLHQKKRRQLRSWQWRST